jgi:hypothetical protein
MPFEKGKAKTGGRKKGSRNKLTLTARQRVEELGCDPIQGIASIAKNVRNPVEVRLHAYGMLKDSVYPKLRATEHTGLNVPVPTDADGFRQAVMEVLAQHPDARLAVAKRLLQFGQAFDKEHESVQ